MTNPIVEDEYTRFVSLFAYGERAVRSFVRSLLPSWRDVDDVMQEVGLACWNKFDRFEGGDSTDEFIRWACVVARFEVLRHRRNHARDRLVLFSEEVIQLLADDGEQRLATAAEERNAVEQCLQRLEEPERRLLLCVHTPGDSIARVARELGQTARRLYARVEKLRVQLADCVRSRVATNGEG